jgi:hypothetical protein
MSAIPFATIHVNGSTPALMATVDFRLLAELLNKLSIAV